MAGESTLLLVLDLAGTFVFALNGALTAIEAARVDVVAVPRQRTPARNGWVILILPGWSLPLMADAIPAGLGRSGWMSFTGDDIHPVAVLAAAAGCAEDGLQPGPEADA